MIAGAHIQVLQKRVQPPWRTEQDRGRVADTLRVQESRVSQSAPDADEVVRVGIAIDALSEVVI